MRWSKWDYFRANHLQKHRDYRSRVMPEFCGQYEVGLNKRWSTHHDYERPDVF